MIVVTTHDSIIPNKGGGALRTTKVAQKLQQRGESVLILAPAQKDKLDDIPIVALRELSNSASALAIAIFAVDVFVKLLSLRKNVSRVWAHNAAVGIPALLFCYLFRKELILDVTDIHTEYMYINQSSSLKRALISQLARLETLVFRHSTKVIVVTQAMKDVFVQRGVKPEKIQVVYDGVDNKKFTNDGSPKFSTFTAVHHGGMQRQDGVEYIIEAAKLLNDRDIDIRFLMIGAEGSSRNEFENLAIRQGVARMFVFKGWLSISELIEDLSRSHLGLIARSDNIANHTITSLKLLDYWSIGLVPVIPKLRGMMEVAEDGVDSIFFELDSAISLAQRIEEIYKNQQCLDTMARRAIAKATKFEWDPLIEEIANIITNNRPLDCEL